MQTCQLSQCSYSSRTPWLQPSQWGLWSGSLYLAQAAPPLAIDCDPNRLLPPPPARFSIGRQYLVIGGNEVTHCVTHLPSVQLRVRRDGPLLESMPALGWPLSAGFLAVGPSNALPTTMLTTVFRAAQDCVRSKVFKLLCACCYFVGRGGGWGTHHTPGFHMPAMST